MTVKWRSSFAGTWPHAIAPSDGVLEPGCWAPQCCQGLRNSQNAGDIRAKMIMEGIGSGLSRRLECDGHALGHVSRVERSVIGGKSVDHLLVIGNGDGGSWADCEVRRVEGEILDSHGDSRCGRSRRRYSGRRGLCGIASTGAQQEEQHRSRQYAYPRSNTSGSRRVALRGRWCAVRVRHDHTVT